MSINKAALSIETQQLSDAINLDKSKLSSEENDTTKKLIINDRVVNTGGLLINDKVSSMAIYLLKGSTQKNVNELIRSLLRSGEYLGVCIVTRFNTAGHLVKNDSIYLVLSMDLKKVIYLTDDVSRTPILEDPPSLFVVVGGKEYDISNIDISSHFAKQASERFKVPIEQVKSLFFDIVVNGQYICVTHCKENQNPAHLFCKENKMVYVSLDWSVAITTYSSPMNSSSVHHNVKEKIANLLLDEIQKLSKIEARLEKRNEKEILYSNLKIAELELEIYNCRNKSKIQELERQLAEIRQHIKTLEDEWIDIVDDIRRHALTLASFV